MVRVFGIKLRPIWLLVIIGIAVLIPLAMVFVITRILISPPASWWWFFGVLGFQALIGFIIGVILLVIRLRRSDVVPSLVSPATAVERAVNDLKYDVDNPDNFIPLSKRILRVGEAGSPRTPVLWLSGKGSECNEDIDCVINLNNPDFECSWLRNAKIEDVREAIKLIAEHPESIIEEQVQTGADVYGKPIFTITKKFVTPREKELEKQKKEAEEQNVM